MKRMHTPTVAAAAVALAAGLTLAACQPAQESAADVAAQARSGAEAVADKVGDAAITVAVNAALAKDEQLSALRIDVDTVDGRVLLAGTAPDEAARERATVLAQQVQGVRTVENRLAIAPAS